MNICEIFTSIQGESTLQGLPTVFVRLAGCNLDCCYCDTRYAKNGGTDMTVNDICNRAIEYGISHVCITGGEPLIQNVTYELVRDLLFREFRVSIETNGTFDAGRLDRRVKRVIDIKCPGSGESGKTHPNNLADIRADDEFKFVITGREDFDYACEFVRNHDMTEQCTVLFSPSSEFYNPSDLADWIITEMPSVRLNLQLHRIIWPGDARGR